MNLDLLGERVRARLVPGLDEEAIRRVIAATAAELGQLAIRTRGGDEVVVDLVSRIFLECEGMKI